VLTLVRISILERIWRILAMSGGRFKTFKTIFSVKIKHDNNTRLSIKLKHCSCYTKCFEPFPSCVCRPCIQTVCASLHVLGGRWESSFLLVNLRCLIFVTASALETLCYCLDRLSSHAYYPFILQMFSLLANRFTFSLQLLTVSLE